MSPLRRHLCVAAALTLLLLATTEPGRAQAPSPFGWTALGQIALDKNGCATCPATFPTPSRFRSLGLVNESPYPISLTGQVELTCTDGTVSQFVLASPSRAGLFQAIPNSCVNLDVKSLRVSITSVSLSPPDADRTVAITVSGRR